MAKAKQVMKFLVLLSVLMAIAWWIDKYDTHPYEKTTESYSQLRQEVWLILALLTGFGVTHVILYSVTVNHVMFKTLSLPTILLLTIGTSGIATARLVDWKIEQYLHGPGWVWLVYYPLLSLGTVLLRYFCLRRKGRLSIAQTSGNTTVPNRPLET
ncbi:hypothetical protein QS713_08920 [Gleimia hominis]|uniref:Uncharacterized protein n=1 Tax=Gleimia hominis TaxID=595468 RepID=A0ABU3ICS9_9ACTO|nr:hypothetical protein [Gleimia hominis]MDT3768180.1 hypothetical protein [Gleimia hominis]